MKSFSYFLIIFYCFLSLYESQENINLPLQRRVYTTNFQSDLPNLKQLTCLEDNPDPLPKKKKKSITQICILRDLFYNVEVTVGKKHKYELAIDLLSPYTWVKSASCKNCYFKKEEFNCNQDCSMDDFNQTHTCLKKNKCEKTNDTASLDYINHNFSGIFVIENLKIESKDEDFPTVNLKRFKIVDVDTINNAPFYKSDGALGLGLEDDLSSDSEGDSGFTSEIFKVVKEFDSRIFSIYIRENNPDDDAYQPTIVFGKVNLDYKDNEDELIKYVQVNNNSKFDWDLPIFSMKLANGDQKTEIQFAKTSGIVTLDTTFIGLPQKELSNLIDFMNNVGYNCKKVKEKYDSLFCSNVKKEDLKVLKFEMVFENDDGKFITVSLDPLYLIKECSQGELASDKPDSCYFRIHQSYSKSVILGEAFLKKFYTVFNLDDQTVGFSEGIIKEDEPIKHIVKREGKKFSRFLKYFFILLGALLLILCPFYVYQLCKIYKRRKGTINYEEGNSIQMDKIGEDTAYDFQQEMKEKLEARRKAEAEQKTSQI